MHLLTSLTDAQVANLINLGLLLVTAIGVIVTAIGVVIAAASLLVAVVGVAISAIGVLRRSRG